jgi:hypothetical protein
MNFNSTSILSLEGDNLANNRAFTKLINNLPIKEKDTTGAIFNGRVMPNHYKTHLFRHKPIVSSNGWIGDVCKLPVYLFCYFKHTIQSNNHNKISSGNRINRRQQVKCFQWNAKEDI